MHLPWIWRLFTVCNNCWIYTSWIPQEEQLREQEQLRFVCKCSFLEIYNEHISDLLDPSSTNLQVNFGAHGLPFQTKRFECWEPLELFHGKWWKWLDLILCIPTSFTDPRRCEDRSLCGKFEGGWGQECAWCCSATNPSKFFSSVITTESLQSLLNCFLTCVHCLTCLVCHFTSPGSC